MNAPSGHHTHRAEHNRARGRDPMAVAEELTRWAPADVEQWLDDLADDPDVSDAQYANAVADSDDDADGSG